MIIDPDLENPIEQELRMRSFGLSRNHALAFIMEDDYKFSDGTTQRGLDWMIYNDASVLTPIISK